MPELEVATHSTRSPSGGRERPATSHVAATPRAEPANSRVDAAPPRALVSSRLSSVAGARHMSGRNQHYLPAVYLAGFAEERRENARDSLLWAGRRSGRVFRQKAANLAAVDSLYTIRKQYPWVSRERNPDALDDHWSHVEQRLQGAVDALLGNRANALLEASAWLTLARFVAQLFVRAPEFDARYVRRVASLVGDLSGLPIDVENTDHINGVRVLEESRLGGAIFWAEWTVLHAPPGSAFITNDHGRLPRLWDTWMGYIVPFRASAALRLLYPQPPRRRDWNPTNLYASPSDGWGIGPVRDYAMTAAEVEEINVGLARIAQAEIYGASEACVRQFHGEMTSDVPPPEALEPVFLSEYRDAGDSSNSTILRLALLTSRPPSAGTADTDQETPER